MKPPSGGLLATLRLMRIALVFTAVSNVWLIVLLTDAFVDQPATAQARWLPLWAQLACTAAVAAGLYVFGMVLNDILDLRRDRTFAPDRPLPAGTLSIGGAVVIALVALLVALAASVPLGAFGTLACLIAAALIVFYNGLGKHLPGVGILALGLIRAVHMLVGNPEIGFCWPVWVTMSFVIAISATAHRLEGKRPTLAGASVWVLVAGWSFATFALVMWMSGRGQLMAPRPWMWVGPAAAVAAYLAMAVRVIGTLEPRAAGQTLMRRGLLWLIVIDASWLLGARLGWQGALVLAMLGASVGTMAAMRHWSASREAVSFRRV